MQPVPDAVSMLLAGPGEGLIENDGVAAGGAVVVVLIGRVVVGAAFVVGTAAVVVTATVVVVAIETSVVGATSAVVEVVAPCMSLSGRGGATARMVRVGVVDPLRTTAVATPATAIIAAAPTRAA